MYENNAQQEQTCYRTGFTQPKKSRRGPLAILLVLTIFLGGINTVFRLLNIRLFREITQDSAIAPASVSFSQRSRSASAPSIPALGLTGTEISSFEQLCYQIPTGFYITEVAPGSAAEKAGILPGDILLRFNGTKTENLETLKNILYAYAAGDSVNLSLFRNNQEYFVELCLE